MSECLPKVCIYFQKLHDEHPHETPAQGAPGVDWQEYGQVVDPRLGLVKMWAARE